MKKRKPHCGDRKCKVSTGIHDGFTFGSGELNDLGFWEFPCAICIDHWNVEGAPEAIEEMIREFQKLNCWSRKETLKYLRRNHSWLFIEAC